MPQLPYKMPFPCLPIDLKEKKKYMDLLHWNVWWKGEGVVECSYDVS